MENLQGVLRNICETKPRTDHLSVFREFLNHLDRFGRQPPRKALRRKSARRPGKGR
jgi:hypothetical protein